MAAVKITGLEEAQRALRRLSKEVQGKAVASGLNRTALAIERREKIQMAKDLDKPVPYTLNSLRRWQATPTRLRSGIFVMDKQAEYLRYTVFGGSLRKIMTPAALKVDQYGNIPGKKGGWAEIARKIKGAQIATRYGSRGGNAYSRRTKGQAGLPGDMFVGELFGVYGLWQRYPKPRGRKARAPRLLVSLDRNTMRAKRWDFFGVAERVARERLAKDMRDAIAAEIAKL